MNQSTEIEKTVHLHIGPNGVFGDEVESIFDQLPNLSFDKKIDFVDDKMYIDVFQEAIDKKISVDADRALNGLGLSGSTVVISRPKLLFSGTPLNVASEKQIATYKLDQLQNSFINFDRVFHLFLTDHLTYFYRVNNKSLTGESVSTCSWRPLVEGVKSRMWQGSRLVVWNAEHEIKFRVRLVAELFGLSLDRAQNVMRFSSEKGVNYKLISKIEEKALQRGWDVFALDKNFEKDQDLFGTFAF